MAYDGLIKLAFSITLLASTIAMPLTASAESGIASVYVYSGGRTASGDGAAPSGVRASARIAASQAL